MGVSAIFFWLMFFAANTCIKVEEFDPFFLFLRFVMINHTINLLDRTEINIIFIWSGNAILGEAKPSPNITLPDQRNMILGEILSNKCFIIPAHVVHTRSIARLIDPDQEDIYQVACSTLLYKLAYCVIYFRMWNFIA